MSQSLPKTRYSDAELEEFRVLIQGKLDKAQNQMDYYFNQLQAIETGGVDKLKGLDDASGATEKEHLIRVAARHKKHIQHLENALLRIQNKVYGICRATGKLIGKERLRAVPHTTLSINAKIEGKKRR